MPLQKGLYTAQAVVSGFGGLFSWGENNRGELGLGDFTDTSSPVQVGTATWLFVDTDNQTTLAIKSDGSLWGWGSTFNYAPGGVTANALISETTGQKSSPVHVGTSSWAAVAAGSNATYAIRSGDGALFAWGLNDAGQLGNNDPNLFDQSSPIQIGTDSWTMVSAGAGNVAAIRTDGTLWTWGDDTFGQLGDLNTGINESSPVQVTSGASSWTMVSAGVTHVAAIGTDGSLWTWGANSNGQLGDGTQNDSNSPIQIGTDSWTMVDVGAFTTAAIRIDGGLFTWGSNNGGALGQGQPPGTDRSSPVQVGSSSWVAVTAGGQSMGAIRLDGTLWTWGSNAFGQLGDAGADRSSPVQIGASAWSAIDSSISHMVAIRSDGGLFGWGGNTNGQLGLGDTTNRSSPVQVGSNSWTTISTQQDHTVGLHTDEALYTWGDNFDGQLGIPTGLSIPTMLDAGPWTVVKTDNFHAAGVKTDGSLWTWGNNQYGEIGNGTSIGQVSPLHIGTDSWTTVGVGQDHTAAIRIDGALFTWGRNDVGQLGQGDTVDRSTPVQVGTDSWTIVDASSHTVAIRSDGGLFTWGYNGSGQLGVNNTGNRSTPIQIGSFSWTAVSASLDNTMGITSDRALWAWGGNFFGQLGQGNTSDQSSPVQVGTLNWMVTSSGFDFTAGIQSNGTLWMWGYNGLGELGLSDLVNRSSPVEVGTGTWGKVSTGWDTTAAITAAAPAPTPAMSAGLFMWGGNFYGQLGIGTTANKYSPVSVGTSSWAAISAGTDASTALGIKSDGTLWGWGSTQDNFIFGYDSSNTSVPGQVGTSSWSVVAAGFDFTAAIKTDGTLWTWGENVTGQLGLGDVFFRSSPVQVGTSSWTAVGVGQGFFGNSGYVIAIKADGSLWSWGENSLGTLGLNDTVDRSSPTLIDGGTWSAVTTASFGAAHTLAIRSDGTLWSWGVNVEGQLGQGFLIPNTTSSPAQVGAASNWTKISAGAEGIIILPFTGQGTSAGIQSDGSLWTWGANGDGQLGQGDTSSRSTPVQVGSSSWTMVSASGDIMGGVTTTGGLYTWGFNGYGQLGLGDLISRSSPTHVGTSSWTFVSVSSTASGNGGERDFICAIRSDGKLFTNGANEFAGELGLGDTVRRSSFTQVGTASWISVGGGGSLFTAGLQADGTLWTWGNNGEGLLGRNLAIRITSPISITSGSWTAIALSNHALAIKSDSTLWAWGYNTNGQLGLGDTIVRSTPVQVGASSWTAIDVGGAFSTAIKSDSTLWAWGNNGSGQLGQGDNADRSSPVQVGTSSWIAVSAGADSIDTTFGILADGTLYGWGKILASTNITLGYDLAALSSPVQVGSSSWTFVSAGLTFSGAIRTGGSLFMWGDNATGELGLGDIISRSSPTQVGALSWTSISTTRPSAGAAGQNGAGIRSDGSLWTWGYNGSGQLGNADVNFATQSSPVHIGASSWTAVSVGVTHMLAIRVGGSLFAWGDHGSGQLGTGTIGTNRSSPTQVGASTWTAISAGEQHSAGIKTDGTLQLWGDNTYGELGDNSQTLRSSPVSVNGGGTWSKVSIGSHFSSAIKTDSGLYLWGSNYAGQLGQSDTTDRSVPTHVGTSSWTAVSVGGIGPGFAADFAFTAAIRTDGGLFLWGGNADGQLGDNTSTSRSSPVQLGTLSWTAVSAGAYHVEAIKSDGTLWTWGGNQSGALGLFGILSPVVISSASWTAISAKNSAAGIKTDGSLWTWGFNGNGELGQGDTTPRSTPVQVGTDSWTAVATGRSNNTAGIRVGGTLYVWGANSNGELGLGDTTDRSSPVQLGTGNWTSINMGGGFTGGIHS